MAERERISPEEFETINKKATSLQVKLNNFITITTKKGRENHDKSDKL